MFLMIISVEEIRELKSVLETLKAELRAEGKAFDENIKWVSWLKHHLQR